MNGEGWGIEAFRPARPLHKLGNKMFLPSARLEEMRVRVISVPVKLVPRLVMGESQHAFWPFLIVIPLVIPHVGMCDRWPPIRQCLFQPCLTAPLSPPAAIIGGRQGG